MKKDNLPSHIFRLSTIMCHFYDEFIFNILQP